MDVTIPLDADLSAFVESQVESGRFSSKSEVIREALHLFRSIDLEGAYSSDNCALPGKQVSTAAMRARSILTS